MGIRIQKVYTKTGDKGSTSLVGGKRVPKDSMRIEAYGSVDELNAIVGLTRAFNQEIKTKEALELDVLLRDIQNTLFDLGSELATPEEKMREGMPQMVSEKIKKLEKIMDRLQEELRPLKSFILPGGGRISAFLHQCRTVCRRTEREVLRLSRLNDINSLVLIYLNRLSDLFFVLSRWVGKRYGEKEFLWEKS